LLLLVPATIFAVLVLRSPFGGFHHHLVLAGTPRRFVTTVVRAGRADARGAIWLDNVFVLSWALVVPRLLRAGLSRWAPERRHLFGLWGHAPRIALYAAATDVAENVLSLAIVGKPVPLSGFTVAIAVLAWTKWILYLGALIGVLGLVVGPLVAPVVRPSMRRLFARLDRAAGTHPEPVAHEVTPSPGGERVGICLSGGGIRAASVSIGALRQLDRRRPDGPSLFRRARWLVAVSGGAYVAGGWRVSRRPGGGVLSAATPDRDGLFDADHPWAATVRARRRFLDNGFLSLGGGILNALARSAAVLSTILALAFVIGAAIGRFVRTRAVHAWFPYADAAHEAVLSARDLVPLRLVLPGGVLLVVASAIVAVSFTRADPARRSSLLRIALVAASLGLLLFVMLIGAPAGVLYGRRVLRALPLADRADEGASVLGGLAAIAVVGAVAGVVVSHVKRRWMRLGGVALAIALLLFTGKVADTHARGEEGLWFEWRIPFTGVRIPVIAIAVVWLLLGECIAAHRQTLAGMYRKRLAATFALGDGSAPPLPPLPYSDEPQWSDYEGADGPELIIAATAHSSSRTFCGVKGYGFTFRPDRVTLHDRTDGTSAFALSESYPRGSWWDGYHRGWLVTRSMALTGAAFASAMGRQALGSTNALLVALNLRLGGWVPNPRFQRWFADRNTSPRVHIGYLLKELLGQYQPHRDPFVYVADGGHRENLGLVELLRERPDVAISIDASGDEPDSFQTLREAIVLAETELDVRIDIDLARVRRRDGQLPLDCVAEGTIVYPVVMGAGTGRLLYGRYQVSEAASASLLQYAAADVRFPNYPTSDQFLDENEHHQLVVLGEHVGARITQLFDGVNP
jgi:hypothetical protein